MAFVWRFRGDAFTLLVGDAILVGEVDRMDLARGVFFADGGASLIASGSSNGGGAAISFRALFGLCAISVGSSKRSDPFVETVFFGKGEC